MRQQATSIIELENSCGKIYFNTSKNLDSISGRQHTKWERVQRKSEATNMQSDSSLCISEVFVSLFSPSFHCSFFYCNYILLNLIGIFSSIYLITVYQFYLKFKVNSMRVMWRILMQKYLKTAKNIGIKINIKDFNLMASRCFIFQNLWLLFWCGDIKKFLDFQGTICIFVVITYCLKYDQYWCCFNLILCILSGQCAN